MFGRGLHKYGVCPGGPQNRVCSPFISGPGAFKQPITLLEVCGAGGTGVAVGRMVGVGVSVGASVGMENVGTGDTDALYCIPRKALLGFHSKTTIATENIPKTIIALRTNLSFPSTVFSSVFIPFFFFIKKPSASEAFRLLPPFRTITLEVL
ncbi:MAG: hypothetical protein ABSE17_03920 [Candidatus Levyibacteriota bacterium]